VHQRLTRWMGVLGGSLLFLLLMLGMGVAYIRTPLGGLSGFIQDGMKAPYMRRFGLYLLATEVFPLYVIVGLVLWVLTLAWAGLPWALGRGWWARWTARQGAALTFLALAWLHLALWWEVPTALWLLPGLNRIPFVLLFPLLVGLILGGAWRVVKRDSPQGLRRVVLIGGWVVLWTGVAYLPSMLVRPRSQASAPGTPGTKVLMIGLDGLRQDTSEEAGIADLKGLRYPNAYTAIPATRLLYGLLWGGDPEHYTVGHAFPAFEELEGRFPFHTVQVAAAKGIRPRFFIDDGGTIGLAGRTDGFDRVEMPARGWENFVNSNLAPHAPLYATWLNVLRVFPTTTPWTPLDAGLKTALERGRGSGWVMYHSCLAHQPLFLTRKELKDIPGWWRMSPLAFRAKGSWVLFNEKDIQDWNPRSDPFLAYRIRMTSVLKAWKSIWNDLDKDPDYAGALKVLFSDHGERFYHVTPEIRLQGIHGFNVDPWEARVPFLVQGPGLPQSGQGPADAVSLLDLRDVVAKLLLDGEKVTPLSFISGKDAVIRYHTLNGEILRTPEKEYREYSSKGIVKGLAIGPDGLWALQYEKPASERSQDVTVARAEQDRLTVFKPLKAGGAHKILYKGYARIGDSEIPEAEFLKEKKKIEDQLFGRD